MTNKELQAAIDSIWASGQYKWYPIEHYLKRLLEEQVRRAEEKEDE